MTRDEINRLIQDNELFHGTVSIGVIMDINHLERFAALVAAAERDRMCEQFNIPKELAHEKAKSNEAD